MELHRQVVCLHIQCAELRSKPPRMKRLEVGGGDASGAGVDSAKPLSGTPLQHRNAAPAAEEAPKPAAKTTKAKSTAAKKPAAKKPAAKKPAAKSARAASPAKAS